MIIADEASALMLAIILRRLYPNLVLRHWNYNNLIEAHGSILVTAETRYGVLAVEVKDDYFHFFDSFPLELNCRHVGVTPEYVHGGHAKSILLAILAEGKVT